MSSSLLTLLLLLSLVVSFAFAAVPLVTMTTYVTSTITVTLTEYVTVTRTRKSHTTTFSSTAFSTDTDTSISTVTSTAANSGNGGSLPAFTTTLTGASSLLPASFNWSSLLDKLLTARVGTIFSFTDYDAILNGKVAGICGLKVNPNSEYWVAISTKYLRADPVYFPNPNVHPLCSGLICVEVFGPAGRMVGQIFDSFQSFKSTEDIIVAGTSFSLLGYEGTVGETTWRFVKCPKSNGLGIFLNQETS